MAKELLFSLTKKDFICQYFRGSGHGGQKRNKTSNACRCIHPESGARGEAQDTRSREQNRKLAFTRMASTPEFKRWHQVRTSELAHGKARLDEYLKASMRPDNLQVEYRNPETGKWEVVE